ncbi:hypothetical protein HAX54_037184 [Datura stramonium]|uniref:Uncharacterized protein n=1 Tax=Datura stramonium TaxID=4076 RepID=A0ABS8SGS7_DATST|nr:hypothetical protein [Datura stramonium]
MKRAKITENRTPPPPLAPSNTSSGQFNVVVAPTTTPPDLLKLAQMAQQPNPPDPAMVHSQLEAPKSPPDDWCVEYDSASEIVMDEELYHSRPPPPPMLSVYDVDPSWTP